MSEVQALVECPVIVGTAGHVDHGKSALIEALTGKNPDRLEVERRRGMTVELGFGELALPSGKIVGLVDVPGHAHYLRAMVQGATGIDVAVRLVDERLTVDALKRSLVQDFDTPVVTRTSHDRILFDVRTLVGDRDIETAASTLAACVKKAIAR